MKFRLVISNSAYSDLEEAIGYYEIKVKGLGKRMEGDFWKSVELIQKRPLAYRIKYKYCRQLMLRKFPYAIVYEIFDKEIVIYRVAHLKMEPKKRYKK